MTPLSFDDVPETLADEIFDRKQKLEEIAATVVTADNIYGRYMHAYDPNALSHSRLNVFNGCRRRFYIEYERGMQRIGDTPEALRMGAAFAKALELNDPKAPWVNTYSTMMNAAQDQKQVDAIAIESSLVEWYVKKYIEIYGTCDYREVEYAFEIPGTSYTFRGAGDGLKAIPTVENAYQGVEDKFKARWDEKMSANLELDQQVTAELFGYREMGLDVNNIRYRVTCKPRIIRKKGRGKNPVAEPVADYVSRAIETVEASIEEYFIEEVQTRSQEQLDQFALFLHDYAGQIEQARQSGIYPQTPQTCSYLGGCAHRELCCGVPSAIALYEVKPGYPGSEPQSEENVND